MPEINKALNMANGLLILGKYDPGVYDTFDNKRTYIHAGGKPEEVTKEEHDKLRELGWYIDPEFNLWTYLIC